MKSSEKRQTWSDQKKVDKKKREQDIESQTRAVVKVNETECNCCGTHLFVLIRTIVPSCAMLFQRSLLWLKVVFLMFLGWSPVIKLSHAEIVVSVMRSQVAALRLVISLPAACIHNSFLN